MTLSSSPPKIAPASAAGRSGDDFRRHLGAFRHADLVGAGEIVDARADRQLRAGGHVRGHLHVDQLRVIAFIDIVHQPGDDQPIGHRILDRPGGEAGRQIPSDLRFDAAVAGVLPISVPALVGLHHQRERHRPAGNDHRRFGHEAGRDRVLARRRELGRRGRAEQHRREPRYDPALQGLEMDCHAGNAATPRAP
jgi:hypothetical protein